MDDLALQRGALSAEALTFLHAVVAEWQLLADLSFADLLLWVPERSNQRDWPTGHVVVAQIRPTTGSTIHPDDLVGFDVAWGERTTLDRALSEDRIERDSEARWRNGLHIVEEAIPVRFQSRTIAVITRHTNALVNRTPSRLELTYLQSANDLAAMVASGHFPIESAPVSEASPRVGDGLIRLDVAGRVTFASPNAASALRRLGVEALAEGAVLGSLVTLALVKHAPEPADESWTLLLSGRVAREFSLETSNCVIDVRAIPLNPNGERIGAVVLLHDVTELHRRERELVTKNATIREIHHRVKNNLQTVAALLRLQSRRVDDPTARQALTDAVQRVAAIAMVHETLSSSESEEYLAFDEIVDGIISMVADVVSASTTSVTREGSFGLISAKQATTLSMILTELIQNALEHSQSAKSVIVSVERHGKNLRFAVTDDGVGFPSDFDLTTTKSLGLSIVSTLVTNELSGSLDFGTTKSESSPTQGKTNGATISVALEVN